MAVQVTMGVDVQNGNPSFFVEAGPSSSYLNINGLNLSGSIGGTNLQIGDLANVAMNKATASVSLQGGLTFQTSSSETDGKLRGRLHVVLGLPGDDQRDGELGELRGQHPADPLDGLVGQLHRDDHQQQVAVVVLADAAVVAELALRSCDGHPG